MADEKKGPKQEPATIKEHCCSEDCCGSIHEVWFRAAMAALHSGSGAREAARVADEFLLEIEARSVTDSDNGGDEESDEEADESEEDEDAEEEEESEDEDDEEADSADDEEEDEDASESEEDSEDNEESEDEEDEEEKPVKVKRPPPRSAPRR